MHLLFSGIYNSHSHFHNPYQKVHPYISRPFFNTPLLPRRHRNIHPCLVTSYHLYPQRSSKKKKRKQKSIHSSTTTTNLQASSKQQAKASSHKAKDELFLVSAVGSPRNCRPWLGMAKPEKNNGAEKLCSPAALT